MKYFSLQGKQSDLTDEEKLNKAIWTHMSVSQRQSLIAKMFTDYMSANAHLKANLLFVDENTDPQIFSSNGYYNHADYTICINERLLLLDQGFLVYSVLCHELVHVNQNYMVCHANEFPDKKEEIELLNIYLNGTDGRVNFCDLKDVHANFHITNFDFQSNISNIFYYLNISERQAYIKQNSVYCKKNTLSEMYQLFNREYKTNLSLENINKIIDVCFTKLYNQQLPSGTYEEQNLQATVMYDIASISNFICNLSDNALHYIDKDKKRQELARYGYTIYNEDPVNNLMDSIYLFVSGQRKICDLTVEEQRVNPKIILLSLFNKKARQEDVKDMDAFVYEIGNMYSNLSGEIKNFIANNFIDNTKLRDEEILQDDV